MNKNKKTGIKKILVRNTSKPIPKTVAFKEAVATNQKMPPKSATTSIFSEDHHPVRFYSPELNSALAIERKVSLVENVQARKTKSVSDLALNEKVTRKVNFPYDQSVYKDLIPLDVPIRTPSVLSSRNPLPQKDREPILSEFVKEQHVKEFMYQPALNVQERRTISSMNNLRLYKVLRVNSPS